jgi:hypothetical protein
MTIRYASAGDWNFLFFDNTFPPLRIMEVIARHITGLDGCRQYKA